jgi:phage terminase small subunit
VGDVGQYFEALRGKRQAFVREYVKHFNGAKAARDAGYAAKVSASAGQTLLTFSDVQAAIAETIQELLATQEVTAESVLQEWKRLAFATMLDFMTWGPDGVILKASHELSPAAAAAVMEVEQIPTEHGMRVRLKLHSKTQGLEALSRYFDLYHEMAKSKAIGEGLASLLREADDTSLSSPSAPAAEAGAAD